MKIVSNIILASGSPRRIELLRDAGCNFEVITADIDESVLTNEAAAELVQRLALAKASKVATNYADSWIIGADTVAGYQEKILGKPLDSNDAIKMLTLLSGKYHEVIGGLAIVNQSKNFQHTECHKTIVKFRELTESEIAAYVATEEPLDKAGAYGIQKYGAQLVEHITGSYTNIVGLNISAVIKVLKEVIHGKQSFK